MASHPRAIDLFCGAGGSSYGARNAGVEIVAGVDHWHKAAEVYKAHFPKAKVFNENIRNLCPKEIKKLIGEIDLIMASPECTNHSNARGGRERSEESRETALEVLRFAKIFRPKWIVIENVIEMRMWHRYSELLSNLQELGYYLRDNIVLNAKDFGVPQSRVRLFLLCSLLGQPSPPLAIVEQASPASVIIDTSDKYKFSHLFKSGRAEATILKARQAIKILGEEQPFLIVYYGTGKHGNGGWQTLDEPLRTITTLDRFAFVLPGKEGHMMRMLQPEELKLAMGFKQDFKLEVPEITMTRRDRIKLMGNGVCPPVMEAIVKKLITQI